ncbi:hypothetical protein BGZ49_003270 [Haplosporangium sp. Z 27]|nr:hypothetical protein BGZ49_003270 [Haplosporangium sp. Z 27]
MDPFHNYSRTHFDTGKHRDEMEQYKAYQKQQQQQQRQYQHRRHYEQELGQEQPPQAEDSTRRKRSFHFEPEFVAALDASLHEQPTLSRSRPTKKPRCSTFTTRDPTYNDSVSNTTTSTTSSPSRSISPSQKSSEGVSIIDLSSGEELASFHLGENEHKRRRESISSSAESLREVFDVLDDGSLRSVTDHAPTLPSPIKRIRTQKDNESNLEILDEHDGVGHKDFQNAKGNKSFNYNWDSNGFDKSRFMNDNLDAESEQDMWMSDDEESHKPVNSGSKAELGALIRYEGPKTMRLADGVDALIKHHWENQSRKAPELINAQGNELVLYRRPPPIFLSTQDLDDDEPEQIHPRFEELGDDDQIQTSMDTYDNDSHIDELEAKIMGMDID